MSLTLTGLSDPTALVDPYQLTDPTALAAPPVPGLVVPGVKPVGHDLLPVALGVAGAFLAARALMSVSLLNDDPPPGRGLELAAKAWQVVGPKWTRWAFPAIAQAYRLGSTNRMTTDEVAETAQVYVNGLGDYLQQTSAQALADGYLAGLGYGWSPHLAWMRAAEGYGLDRVQMRSYLQTIASYAATLPATLPYAPDAVPPVARRMLDRALALRAHKVGHNEAWNAAEVGKVVSWLVEQHRGRIPVGTRKRWVTAHDERVCGVCGALDAQVVDLADRFEVPGGEGLIAPGAHPNCRCSVELVYPTVEVVKNVPGDPYNRDAKGEFSTTERRAGRLSRLKPVAQTQRVARVRAKVAEKTPGQSLYEKIMEQPVQAEPTHEPEQPPSKFAAPTQSKFAADTPSKSQSKFAVEHREPKFAAEEPEAPAPSKFANPAGGSKFGTGEAKASKFTVREWYTGPKVHVIHKIVYVKGKPPQVVTSTVTTDHKGIKLTKLYVPGYQVHTAMDEHGLEVPDELSPGDVIDLDFLASPIHAKGGGSELHGYEDTGGPHGEDRTPHALYKALEREDISMAGARHEDEMLEQDLMMAQDHEAAHLSANPELYLNRMSEHQMDAIIGALDEGSPGERIERLAHMTEREKREEILTHLENEDDSWWEMMMEEVIYSGEGGLYGEDMNHALRAYEDSTLDETVTPVVYILHGWEGAYSKVTPGTKVSTVFPEGRYQVVHVARHDAADVPFVGFENFVAVHLVPENLESGAVTGDRDLWRVDPRTVWGDIQHLERQHPLTPGQRYDRPDE